MNYHDENQSGDLEWLSLWFEGYFECLNKRNVSRKFTILLVIFNPEVTNFLVNSGFICFIVPTDFGPKNVSTLFFFFIRIYFIRISRLKFAKF